MHECIVTGCPGDGNIGHLQVRSVHTLRTSTGHIRPPQSVEVFSALPGSWQLNWLPQCKSRWGSYIRYCWSPARAHSRTHIHTHSCSYFAACQFALAPRYFCILATGPSPSQSSCNILSDERAGLPPMNRLCLCQL
jgi:hypothetical protein